MMQVVYLRMEIAARKGEPDVVLFVFPSEVQELEKEGFSCKKERDNWYRISWENVYADLPLSQWKEICDLHKPKTQAEKIATLAIRSLVA